MTKYPKKNDATKGQLNSKCKPKITRILPYQTNMDRCQKKTGYTPQKITKKCATILVCMVGQKFL